MPKNNNQMLPPPKTTIPKRLKTYLHVYIDPDLVRRLKSEAQKRGYKVNEFVEEILRRVLPK